MAESGDSIVDIQVRVDLAQQGIQTPLITAITLGACGDGPRLPLERARPEAYTGSDQRQ